MLLSRYLGNKSALLGPILELTAGQVQPGDRVLDAFGGSLAVSIAYKAAGYRVSTNDLNRLSAVFARAYVEPTAVPVVSLDRLLPKRRASVLRSEADGRVRALQGVEGFMFLADPVEREAFRDLVALLGHLQLVDEDDLPSEAVRTDFFDSYCPEGRFSAFRSSRGSTGRRRFLTAENAHRLDLVLSQLRHWRRNDEIDQQTLDTCLAVLCHSVEKVANTQGTYHDFPRETWDSRAFKPLLLVPPPFDQVVTGPGGHTVGNEDSIAFVARAGHHRLMYVDPPYNFRQYTAYYFLPNLICRYPDLEDVDSYFQEITFVRGQHPEDDHSSDFCSAPRFMGAMRGRFAAAEADYVLVSYFTGKNHWSKFDSDRDDTGLTLLSDLLQSEMFVSDSLVVREVARKNYASYGGYQARNVHELLLLAEKKH